MPESSPMRIDPGFAGGADGVGLGSCCAGAGGVSRGEQPFSPNVANKTNASEA
jgi:hypothetical protein